MNNAIIITGKETNNGEMEALAEQWVNLVFEHISYLHMPKNKMNKQYKTTQKYELYKNTK